MFSNLKEFINVVHDGLSSNNNLRQKLQEVQKFRNIFKEKQKPASDSSVNFGAGGDILDKYQENWAELHSNADANARSAEGVDKLIMELHNIASVRLHSANEFGQNMSYFPNLTASIAQCVDSLKNIQSLLKDVEEDLVDLEDAFERNKMDKWKLDHHYHLSLYKEKKLAALEEVRCKLSKKNTELNCEREKRQLAELQMKRETSAMAFQNDVAQYLASGSVPTGSSSPKMTLDQIKLDDDVEDLEKFLES